MSIGSPCANHAHHRSQNGRSRNSTTATNSGWGEGRQSCAHACVCVCVLLRVEKKFDGHVSRCLVCCLRDGTKWGGSKHVAERFSSHKDTHRDGDGERATHAHALEWFAKLKVEAIRAARRHRESSRSASLPPLRVSSSTPHPPTLYHKNTNYVGDGCGREMQQCPTQGRRGINTEKISKNKTRNAQ